MIKKIFKFILAILVLSLCMYAGYYLASKDADYVCQSYSGELEDVEYLMPNYELLIGTNEDSYFIEVTLNFVDNDIVFEGDEIYMSINLNGTIAYSISELEDYVAITLEDGKLPSSISVFLDAQNYQLDSESENILIDYLSGNREETTSLSICLYDTDGKIIKAATEILNA